MTNIHIYIYTRTYVYMHIHIYICDIVYMREYLYIYICTDVYTHFVHMVWFPLWLGECNSGSLG